VKPILVLGLGNPLQRDDGVGTRVIEELERRELSPHVQVMDGGTPGVGLIHLMEGYAHVVIVDAAEMGRPPGEIVRFRAKDVMLTGSSARFSLHRSGVADALALAQSLNISLPEIVVYGVQPAHVDWGEELSAEVAAAIPTLVEAIVQETQLFPETGQLKE
jgi:hydrogenase maturation protease